MSNTPTTTMRLDPELKGEAMRVFEPLGLNMTTAVNMFLKAVVREQGIRSTCTPVTAIIRGIPTMARNELTVHGIVRLRILFS